VLFRGVWRGSVSVCHDQKIQTQKGRYGDMTIELFITLFGIGSVISSLLTETLKQTFTKISSNVIALIDAVIVGGVGTFVYYILTGAEITPINALYAVLMALCVWVGSMVGYDKVMQTLKQIGA
jgi:hypothetical protein